MSREHWRALGDRVERRLVRALDVASILLLDSTVLVFVYGLLWAVDRSTSDTSTYFQAVKYISHGIGFLLYLVWAGWDIVEFLRESTRRHV